MSKVDSCIILPSRNAQTGGGSHSPIIHGNMMTKAIKETYTMCRGREEKGRIGELPWRDSVLTETGHDSVARGLIPIRFGLNKREISLVQVNVGQR